jgi:hypothetical protein
MMQHCCSNSSSGRSAASGGAPLYATTHTGRTTTATTTNAAVEETDALRGDPYDQHDTNPNEANRLCVPLFAVFLLLGWLVWICLTFALLASDNTLAVNGLCGQLWDYMLIRTLGFLVEMLLTAAQLLDVESMVRACAGVQPLGADDEGGCCALMAGGEGVVVEWMGTLGRFVYHCAFGLAGAVVIPSAVVDRAPCCANALAATSLTGTYTLAAFAWVYLFGDWIQAAVRGTWLVHRHFRRDEAGGSRA